jgi:competence protein ComEC
MAAGRARQGIPAWFVLFQTAHWIGLAWWHADAVAVAVAVPALAPPAIVTFTALVEAVEPLPARKLVRVRLVPLSVEPQEGREPPVLPPRVRVNLATIDVPEGLTVGAVIQL